MTQIRTWCMALVGVFALAMQALGETAPDWKQVAQPDTIIGYFAVSNVETKALVETDGSKLAVFATDGECRGVANVIDGPKGRFFSLSIGIASSTERGLTLKCWDVVTQTAVDVNDYTIDASAVGEQIGRLLVPVVVTVGVVPIVTHAVTFDLGSHGTRTGGGELTQTVEDGAAAIAPTVEANDGWTFTGWDKAFDTVTADLTVTAQWTAKTFTMSVGGKEQEVTYGQQMTLREADRIDGYAQFVCVGWTGTGDVPASGLKNEVSFTVTQTSSITWLYQTNYWFEAKATSGGAVTVAETGYAANPSGGWVPVGATIDLSATAKVSSAKFTAWNDLLKGGTFSQEPSLSLTIDGPYRLQAKFVGGEPSPEKDFKYTKNNGQATITGYKGSGGDVVIPETLGGVPVTVIGEKAFYDNTTLEYVYVPNGVVEIGACAFEWCSKLNSIDLPASLRTIGSDAFNYNRALTSFTVDGENEKYTVVDGVLFSKDLTVLEFYPSGRSCDLYVVPESVETIGGDAFYGLRGEIGSLVIPESVTDIGYWSLFTSNIGKLTFEDRCVNRYVMVGTEKANIWVKAEDYDYWTEIFGLGISVIEAEGTTYDIVFDANGGEGEMAGLTNIVQGAVTNLPACTFENASAPIFFGWALSPDGDVAIADEAEVSSLAQEGGGVVTLYAVWSPYHVRAGEAGTIAPPESTLSYPTWSAKGLPKGLKIVSKSYSVWQNGAYLPAGTIYGTATTPGTAIVKVTAKSGTVSETFDVSVVVGNYVDEALPLEDGYDAQVGVKTRIELGDDFASAKVSGLPAGLKFATQKTTDKEFGEIAAGTVYGVATKTVTNAVIFTKKDGTVTHTASTTFAVAAAPTWSVGTFNGRLDDGSGSATFTVAANGKISGKVIANGKTWSFSSSGYDENEDFSADTESLRVVTATAKSGKLTADVAIAVGNGEVAGSIVGDETDAVLAFWRNEWKDKGATDKLKDWVGLYTVQLEGGETGYGYLSLTLDAKGNCKATGKLPDGTSAAATLPLVWDDEKDVPMAIWQVVPGAYKGGYVGGLLTWGRSEDAATRRVSGDEIAWVSRAPAATAEYGTGFERTLFANGAYYDKLANLSDYYSTHVFCADAPILDVSVKTTDYDEYGKRATTTEVTTRDAVCPSCWGNLTVSLDTKGTAFVVDQGKATKPLQDKETKEWSYEGDNDAALTFSFAKATGIFKGSFTCWYDYTSATDNTKDSATETVVHASKKVSYEGVMVFGESLRGFYLWDRTGTYDDEKTGKEKTYKYKESKPVVFE